MLIVIRNPEAIKEGAMVVAVAVVVDKVHLAVSAMENQATMVKHSVLYSAASHTTIRQQSTSRYERSMESGSRTVVQHTTCIITTPSSRNIHS
jgi:hypothetical protein